ncbi:non-homologous end-joining DNA ligase [Gordonia sp. PDNC005]|uniref:non-homologous end-joining DNA ligase n=1 Tax=Gordonia sp. PDNC005 TaxID=2811424 RepID=UPI001963352A|nr:non-homologous end-joining DNA ligase [Gordonia sp. PDNC005]QRY62515.1 non-homologous end-joining DNA ligase [Gordonia sp. PDNC005]
MPGSKLEVDGRHITVTNLEKVMYPESGTRKFDVIQYVIEIADSMLPHVASRPITRKRWPHGTGSGPFFEKALPPGTPDWLARFTIEHSESKTVYPVARSAADLVWLAQMAALELHVPQWRIDLSGVGSAGDESRRTDRLVIDLDPGPDVSLHRCAEVAIAIRDVLADAGLPSYPVTSGGKGIHVYARFPKPVKCESARAVAKQIATSLAAAHPAEVTATMAKAARQSKVFLDWSQNTAAKTTLAPYSLRGRERPWVAAPRTWDELADPTIAQLDYRDVLERHRESGDLLADLDPPVVPLASAPVDLGEYRKSKSSRLRSAPSKPSGPTVVTGGSRGPRPMLAADELIDGLTDDAWAFEGKWDGYRILARHTDGDVRLSSRSGIDMTADFPELRELGSVLRGFDVLLDGEMVAIDATGRTDFTLLASRHHRDDEFTLRYMVFDVLELNGTDLTSAPWEQRRAVLDELTPMITAASIADVPPLLPGPGAGAAEHAREQGWEGVVAKRRTSTYQYGRRSADWRKHKNWNDIEVVVGGFRPGRGSRSGSIGSLLIGLPTETGLRYIGRVGTGFTDADLDALHEELKPLIIGRSPFIGSLDKPVASSATWVLPKLVTDVRFMDWTSTGHLRHPSWRGIRRDKLPGDL